MRSLNVVVTVAVCLPAVSVGQLIYPIQQDRSVVARVSPAEPNEVWIEQFAATDFGIWQGDACASTPSNGRAASAGQYSVCTGDTINAFGSADFNLFAGPESWTDCLTHAQNVCRVRFAVPEPLTFDALGYISVEWDAQSWNFRWSADLRVAVQLNEIAGPLIYADEVVIHVTSDSPGEPTLVDAPVLTSGELAPGVYELVVSAELDGHAFDGYGGPPVVGQASYVVSTEFAASPAEVPGEGDLDQDGDVDIADFARMQRAFTGPQLH